MSEWSNILTGCTTKALFGSYTSRLSKHFNNKLSKILTAATVFVLAAFLLVLSIYNSKATPVKNLSNSNHQQLANPQQPVQAEAQNSNVNESQTQNSTTTNSPPASPGSNNSSSATVSINGQSVSASTSGPNQSVTRTLNTDSGSASISIQTDNSNSGGRTHTSQNIRVNSNAYGTTSSNEINQQSSLGGQ
jgi:predicted PurR-regulated permease PerM